MAVSIPFGLRRFVAARFYKMGLNNSGFLQAVSSRLAATTDPAQRQILMRQQREFVRTAEADYLQSLAWSSIYLNSRYQLANTYTRIANMAADPAEIAEACRRGKEEFDWFARNAPDFAEVPFYHGLHLQVCFVLGHEDADRRGAVEQLERAVGMTNDPQTHLTVASALKAMGETERLRKLYWRILDTARRTGRMQEYPATLRSVLDSLMPMAMVSRDLEERVAVQRYRLELAPDPAVARAVLVDLVDTLSSLNRPDEAAEILKGRIERDPRDAMPRHLLLQILLANGRDREALSQIEALIALERKSAPGESTSSAESISSATAPSRFRPMSPETLRLQGGRLLEAAGRTAEARRYYEDVLRVAPRSSQAARARQALDALSKK
jgi:tetratricopeptide (TPR) repeat protein